MHIKKRNTEKDLLKQLEQSKHVRRWQRSADISILALIGHPLSGVGYVHLDVDELEEKYSDMYFEESHFPKDRVNLYDLNLRYDLDENTKNRLSLQLRHDTITAVEGINDTYKKAEVSAIRSTLALIFAFVAMCSSFATLSIILMTTN
jgi:hypothetical protein